VDLGFALLALVSTLICVGGISYILHRERVPLSMFAATALLPVWAVFDHGYLLPDIFWDALLTIFLLCLWRKSYGLAAALLLPLYMARESTLLVLLCLLVSGIRYLRLRAMVGAILASAAGALAGQYLARGSQGNVHHLPTLVYLLAKVPFNLMKNIFGVQLWLNTLHFTNPPLWTWQVPPWLHLGGIKVVGICSFDPYFPSWTLLSWLGGFGVLPLVLCKSLRSGQLQEGLNNFFLRFCLLYGLISYLAGPLLGASIYRLVLYGWPAFLLALPLIWPKGVQTQLGLMIAHLLCGWTAFAVMVSERPGNEPFDYRWIGLAVLLACWAFGRRKSDPRLGRDPAVAV
jgi:hypothetical protein